VWNVGTCRPEGDGRPFRLQFARVRIRVRGEIRGSVADSDPMGFGVDNVNISSTLVTLTPDQYSSMTLVVAGAFSQNASLIFPAARYQKMVHNATSGAVQLTCKTAAGTGVVIPQGTIKWIYCDGTNIVSGT